MDFSWTDEQRALRRDTVAFAEACLNDGAVEDDRAGTFPREKWRMCAEFGVQGLHVPTAYGGQGRDALTTVLAMEGLGYGCRENSLPYAIGSQMWTVQDVILKVGSEAQKRRWLPPLCAGEAVAAFGITEAETGSDTYALQMRAEAVDGGYVLNGRKVWITSAPVADLALVFASTDPEKGRWGLSVFVVERGAEGFSTTPAHDKMGMRTTPMGDMIFEDCFVAEDQRVGPEGVGVSLFATAMQAERGYLFASSVGRLERQLEEAAAYASERRAFGQPIGRFQSVSNRIVDMRLRLETARMLLYKVAWLDQTGQPAALEAALAKLHLSECFVASSLDAIRVQGARGYVTEFGVERDLRDGVGGLIYSGTSDIQRNVVARLMGL
jgi:alkylation response protein AidB-like acyl-CoA dehydrogenase